MIKHREEANLTLRKDAIADMINRKRYDTLANQSKSNSFVIEQNELKVNQDLVAQFYTLDQNSQLIYIRQLLQDQNEDNRMFAVYNLRLISSKLKKSQNIYEMIPKDLFEEIAMLLLNTNNLKLQYEITWIMIDVTHNFNEYSNYLMSDFFIIPFYHLLTVTTEPAILKHMFWIFANLFSEENSEIIFKKVDIGNYVLHYFSKDNLPFILKDTLLWLIGVMYKTFDKQFANMSKPYVNIILKYITVAFNSDIFSEALNTVYRMAETQDNDLITLITNSQYNIPKLLVSYINTSTQLNDINSIIKIAESVSYSSFEFGEQLRLAGIFENSSKMFEHLIQTYIESHSKLVKECILSMLDLFDTLIFSKSKNANEIIRNTDIPRSLLYLLNLNNSELNQAVWNFLNNTVKEGDTRVGTEILRHEVVEKVCKCIIETNDTKLILMCLGFINTLLHHGTLYIPGNNIITSQMERLQIDSHIEKLALNSDNEISQLAIEVYETYFKK